MSIKKTINVLFQDARFCEVFFSNMNVVRSPGRYSCFQDGSKFRTNSFLNDQNKLVLLIQLFFDDMGITNPLRGHSAFNKFGMFYFTLLNLPPMYLSSTNNIHLVAMANSIDLTTDDGLNVIFDLIYPELRELEEHGMDIEIPGKGITKVFAVLAQFTGDNLAMNQAFGLVTSFKADYCCTLCYATRGQMQVNYREMDYEVRTLVDYNKDLLHLDNLPLGENYRGVKRTCTLNKLSHFHMVKNWVNDCMHTVLEGILPLLTGSVLYSLSKKKLITLELVNERIQWFYDGLKVDRSDKPCFLNDLKAPGKGLSPKLGAAEMWSLFRYLPLMLAEFIDSNDQHWELFIRLQEIVDIVFAPTLYESTLDYFEIIYAEFLNDYKELYPELNVTPKLHFLVHFSSIVRKNGPMRTYWVMNHERLNGAVKIPARIMNNFRNPALTLAYRRQCTALQNQLVKGFGFVPLLYGSSDSIDIECLHLDMFVDGKILSTISNDLETVAFTDKVTFRGVNYKVNQYLIIEKIEDKLQFGQIDYILINNPTEPFFVISQYETIRMDYHTHSYLVKRSQINSSRLISGLKLHDHYPLDPVTREEMVYLRPKYYVM